MSAQDLAVLRTSKIAMGEGLITQEDFDQVKVAFLKAQQIKAGLDAGFIREEDYVQARDSFLHSLDFRVAAHHHNGPAATPAVLAAAAPVLQPTRSQGNPALFDSRPSSGPAAPFQAPTAPAAQQAQPRSSVAVGMAQQPRSSIVVGAAPLPADLPWLGRPAALAGKVGGCGEQYWVWAWIIQSPYIYIYLPPEGMLFRVTSLLII